MPMKFSEICTLLQRLEDIETREPRLLSNDKAVLLKQTTESWFKSYRASIDTLDARGASSLLSAFLPERRTDRVYNIQSFSLCRILGRALCLGSTRQRELQLYREPGHGDLASCLERVLKASNTFAEAPIFLQEVDDMLHSLASHSNFSAPDIRQTALHSSLPTKHQIVRSVVLRATPAEGKWLVRIILKDLAPVRVHEGLVLKNFHFLLPDLLRYQNNFHVACNLLKGALEEYPSHPDPRSENLFRRQAAEKFTPVVGVKVGRLSMDKARSIQSCIDKLGDRRWVLERKYDGEYCEVHVDLGLSHLPKNCIQIFSKSGKNSTEDRAGLHSILIECLRLGQPDCKIKRQVILLGEMVVFSDTYDCIQPFEEVRKHVSRSGRSLGTEADSVPSRDDHLAIVFFDVLLLDDEVVMRRSVEERRQCLREICKKKHGSTMTAEWKIVDFADRKRSTKLLEQQFAASIWQRCEGLVLKPCGVPYLPNTHDAMGPVPTYIKVKKDYFEGLGDEADFAVVGASYNAQLALKSVISDVKFTSFFLACLLNKAEVERFDARPAFQVVNTIEQGPCIPKSILNALNQHARNFARPYSPHQPPLDFDLRSPPGTKMDSILAAPPIVEVLGSGYEKPASRAFFALRHARIKKLHEDRSWKECVSFEELQNQAKLSRQVPSGEFAGTENRFRKLVRKLKRKSERARTSTSPQSATTSSPRSRSTSSTTRTETGRLATEILTSSSKSPIANASFAKKRHLFDTTDQGPPQPGKRNCYSRPSGRLGSSPLAEIKNISSTTCSRPAFSARHPINDDKISPVTAAGPRISSTTVFLDSSSPLDSQCTGKSCLFANTVIYLAPCIQATPYITEDLMQVHCVSVVPDLAHWDRNSLPSSLSPSTVAESQAYAGLSKVVLVETKRRAVVADIIRRVLALNRGRFTERVKVYDWRVLEDVVGHSIGSKTLEKHFVGISTFDPEQEQAVFVPMVAWLRH